jgi:hypothetical protein
MEEYDLMAEKVGRSAAWKQNAACSSFVLSTV